MTLNYSLILMAHLTIILTYYKMLKNNFEGINGMQASYNSCSVCNFISDTGTGPLQLAAPIMPYEMALCHH